MKKLNLNAILLFSLIVFSNLQGQSQTKTDSTSEKLARVPFQISFVPYFGTNPVKNSSVDVSVNILGGINKQINAFEIGGIFNIVEQNSGNCQLSGIMNITGKQAHGLQAAGILNLAESVEGSQMAGYINIAKTDIHGAQIAGIANFAGGKVNKVQIAGILSVAPEINGVQMSGIQNISENVVGVQIAGIINVAQNVNGSQIGGIVNIAKKVTGCQIGLINIADTCSGLPIGLISYVRKGYHKLEISADEFSYVRVACKTGVKRLYGIIGVGYRPFETETPVWNCEFGMGSLFGGNEKFQYNIEITSSQVFKGTSFDYDNELHRIYFGIDRKLTEKTSVDFGLTYNFFTLDKSNDNYARDFKSMAKYTFTDNKVNGYQLQTWLGARVGFRF